MKRTWISMLGLLLAAPVALTAQAPPPNCAGLAGLSQLKSLNLTAVPVPARTISRGRGPRAFSLAIPAHCQVDAVVQSAPDSRIQVEVWLPPAQSWNGKFLGTGNGGYSSAISIPDMADGLRRGYAVGASDTGHQGGNLNFGAGHPQKIRDWAYRSTHVMAQTAERIVAAYYARSASEKYFKSCSTGGQQALSEAQRYPKDFNGIVAGDPGNDRIALNGMFLWSWLVTHPVGQPPLSPAKLPMVTQAALKSCAAADGLIHDPYACHPDLAPLRCTTGSNAATCLTDADVHQIQQLYAGPRNAAGRQLYPGWPPGSESGWRGYFVGKSEPARIDFWRLWVFNDPNWNPRSFEFQRDVDRARAKLPYVDATSPDLSGFKSTGGKLILYHGLADPVVPPQDTVNYFNSVRGRFGNATPSFARLFLVPGMSHCGGGIGPDQFDTLAALNTWVVSDAPPDHLIATGRAVGKKPASTGLLCPYPAAAVWSGQGSSHSAANYACRLPPNQAP